jgi:hypothetical protein
MAVLVSGLSSRNMFIVKHVVGSCMYGCACVRVVIQKYVLSLSSLSDPVCMTVLVSGLSSRNMFIV